MREARPHNSLHLADLVLQMRHRRANRGHNCRTQRRCRRKCKLAGRQAIRLWCDPRFGGKQKTGTWRTVATLVRVTFMPTNDGELSTGRGLPEIDTGQNAPTASPVNAIALLELIITTGDKSHEIALGDHLVMDGVVIAVVIQMHIT